MLTAMTPYFALAGGLATLLAVWINIVVTGRRARTDRARDESRRSDDNARLEARRVEDAGCLATARAESEERGFAATAAQFVGISRVVRERLAVTYLVGGYPIEGYAVHERFLDIAYSGPVAALAAARNVTTDFFRDLGEFERAFGSMRNTLTRINAMAPPGSAFSSAKNAQVESTRAEAVAAAEATAEIVDRMRLLFGDGEVVPEPKFHDYELTPAALAKRKTEASRVAPPQAQHKPTFLEANDIVQRAICEIDPSQGQPNSTIAFRILERGQKYDVYLSHANHQYPQMEEAIRFALGESFGAVVDQGRTY